MPTTEVIDLSHWNTVTNWTSIKNAGVLGVIHKATEGNYNTDGTYSARRNSAKAAGLLWGAYHFGTHDNVEQQVNRFLSVVQDDDDALLALDLEDYGDKSMSLDQARDFIEQVEDRTGRDCVLYSGNRIKELLGSKVDPWWGEHKLWLAQYGSTPTVQASWQTYWLWQFSDKGRVDGVTGDVDTNHYEGDPEDLRIEWSGTDEPVPLPPEPPAPPAVITIAITLPPGCTVDVAVNKGGFEPVEDSHA